MKMGIKSDFVLASSSVPVNYDYTRLNVETRTLAVEGQNENAAMEDNNNRPSSNEQYQLALFLGWWLIS